MQVSTALFQEIKNRLKREYGNTTYFTRKTLETMLTDRKEAYRRFDEGENVNRSRRILAQFRNTQNRFL